LFRARDALADITRKLQEKLVEINDIKTSGAFNTIPQELKDTMLRWETIFKDAKTAIQNDQDILDIYQWNHGYGN
jgi:hypothetical protein